MPPSVASVRHTILIALILSVSKVISSYSYYIKKGLVYIIITAPSSRQPSSYAKYTKANIRSSCNVYSISNAKSARLATRLNLLVPYLIYYRVSDLIYC